MAAPIMTFNGAQVRVNAGECDGSETVHEIRTEADAERLFGKGSTAYGLAMMGLRSHTEIRALFGEADARGPDRTGMVLAELTHQGTTSAPEMRDTPGPCRRATVEIHDNCGVILVRGEVSAVRVSHDRVRVTGEIRACATGTATAWHMRRADGVRLFSGPVSTFAGANTLHLNTTDLTVGRDISLALDVYGSAEEMRALFGDERVKVATASGPASCSACGGSWGPVADVDGWRKRHEETCAAIKRRAREAPLVALVNAVPKGLDPTGWRAAVLCAHEAHIAPDRDTLAWWIRQPPGGNEPPPVAAYRRAIAPHKAPAPERRQGGKAFRLTVDDGREDD